MCVCSFRFSDDNDKNWQPGLDGGYRYVTFTSANIVNYDDVSHHAVIHTPACVYTYIHPHKDSLCRLFRWKSEEMEKQWNTKNVVHNIKNCQQSVVGVLWKVFNNIFLPERKPALPNYGTVVYMYLQMIGIGSSRCWRGWEARLARWAKCVLRRNDIKHVRNMSATD